MFKELIKIANELDRRGLTSQANTLDKLASKAAGKAAKGINWSAAEGVLSGPGAEPSRDDIISQVKKEPAFPEEDIEAIRSTEPLTDLGIEEDFAKRLNKKELVFLELGAFLLKPLLPDMSLIKDYLFQEKGLKQPGDLSGIINIDITSRAGISEEFEKLNKAQEEWHNEARQSQGSDQDKYLTHEVVHDFEDGWTVVYVPAAGEGPSYRGNNNTSNDRTVEGNICGLCLGGELGLYQTNKNGEIYSVRNPKNEPKVTIRINRSRLQEAKGPFNSVPGVEGALHADRWFASLAESSKKRRLNYTHNNDYKKFPPLTIESARKDFGTWSDNEDGLVRVRRADHYSPWSMGWLAHWYKKGVSEIDKEVETAILENDPMVFRSGFAKKYKELAEPVVRYWAANGSAGSGGIFKAWSRWSTDDDFKHEVWKTYRKSDWMQEAVEQFLGEDLNKGLQLDLHMIPEYKALVRTKVESVLTPHYPRSRWPMALKVEHDLKNDFFKLKLHEVYPDIGEDLAEEISQDTPYEYFSQGLNLEYPSFAEKASFACAAEDMRQPWVKDLLAQIEHLEPGEVLDGRQRWGATWSEAGTVRFRFFKEFIHIKGSAEAGNGLFRLLARLEPESAFNSYRPPEAVLNGLDIGHRELLEGAPLSATYAELVDTNLVASIASKSPAVFFNKLLDYTPNGKPLALGAAKSLLEKDISRYFLPGARPTGEGMRRLDGGYIGDLAGQDVEKPPAGVFDPANPRPNIFLDYYSELEPAAIKRLISSPSVGLFFKSLKFGEPWAATYMKDYWNEIAEALLNGARPDPNMPSVLRGGRVPSSHPDSASDDNGDPWELEQQGRREATRDGLNFRRLEYFHNFMQRQMPDGTLQELLSSPSRRSILPEVIKQWAVSHPEVFLQERLWTKYPQFRPLAIKSLLFKNISAPMAMGNLNLESIKDFVQIEAGQRAKMPPEVERILRATAELYPDIYLKAELYKIYPEQKDAAVYALAEEYPEIFLDNEEYELDYPELKGVAHLALNRQMGGIPPELPDESPIDYREVPIGQEIEAIDEDDYFDDEYGDDEYGDDDGPNPDGEVLIGHSRKMANLKTWLTKNDYTVEARRLADIIRGTKNGSRRS